MDVASSRGLAATEQFFTQFDDVVLAQVWARGDMLLSRVLVTETSTLSGQDLKEACARELGKSLTPDFLLLERVKPTPLRLAS